MGKRLYVGNLSETADAMTLRELFAQDGRKVRAVELITDFDTGRPRGFGYVEMENEADAESAHQALHRHPLDGRPLKVDFARERPRR